LDFKEILAKNLIKYDTIVSDMISLVKRILIVALQSKKLEGVLL